MIEAMLLTASGVAKDYSNTGPGSKTLIAGNEDAGFFGEVSSAELIGYAALKTHLGFSAGSVVADAGWLKFIHKGVIKFISKKGCYNGLTWNALYAAGGIYGTNDDGLYPATTPKNQHHPFTVSDGTKVCTLVPKLISGSAQDPTTITTDVITDYNSEYSDLLYRIIPGTHVNAGTFAQYVKADVYMHVAHAVVETISTNVTRTLIRGYQGVINSNGQSLTKADPSGYSQCCRMVLVLESVV